MIDWSKGTSSWQVFNPNSSVLLETYNYTGTEGSGTLYSHLIDWSGGNSQLQLAAPAAGINQADLNYSGADAMGILQSALFDLSSGQSVIKFINPSNAVLSEVDTYNGPEQSGALIGQITDLKPATSSALSVLEVYNIGNSDPAFSGNVANERAAFTGFDGNGVWINTTANFATPGYDGSLSAVYYYHYGYDSFGTSVNIYQTAYYAGANGSGTMLAVIDHGGSPGTPYNAIKTPNNGYTIATFNTSGIAPPTAAVTNALEGLSNHVEYYTGLIF